MNLHLRRLATIGSGSAERFILFLVLTFQCELNGGVRVNVLKKK